MISVNNLPDDVEELEALQRVAKNKVLMIVARGRIKAGMDLRNDLSSVLTHADVVAFLENSDEGHKFCVSLDIRTRELKSVLDEIWERCGGK